MNRERSALVALALLSSLAACGGTDDPASSRIGALENCAEVQQAFDTAVRDNDRAAPGSDQHRQTLDYMKAAQERLEDLDCL